MQRETRQHHLPTCCAAFALAIALATVCAAQVVPTQLANVAGGSNSGALMGDFRPMRIQQVYLGTDIDDGPITSIRFRQDEVMGSGAASCIWSGATVVLSSTTAAPDGLSTTFADNLGNDATIVAQGDLVLTTTDSTANPRPFNYITRLSTSFDFDSSSNMNLLLDITLPTQDSSWPCSGRPILDSHTAISDSISEVLCFNGSCSPTFDTATSSDTGGMVTRFVHAIFEDGFESNNLAAWSTSQP